MSEWADLHELDRRSFLRWLGVAAGAGLLPGCGGDGFAARSRAVLNAASARLVGPQGGALVAARRVDPAAYAEAFLAGAPELAASLRQALWLVEYGVWPVLGKWRPFTALDGPAQDAILAELRDSRIALKRLAFGGLRSLALTSFYGALEERPVEGFAIGRIPPDAAIRDAMTPLRG